MNASLYIIYANHLYGEALSQWLERQSIQFQSQKFWQELNYANVFLVSLVSM